LGLQGIHFRLGEIELTQILNIDEAEVTLQVYAKLQNGAKNLNIASGTVRVYHMVSGSEVEDRTSVALTQVGSTNKWRYTWNPVSLAAGEYTAEYSLLDNDGLNFVGQEDITVGVDVAAVSGDPGAADNIEATYDGTGYENEVAPAQQQQLDQIALTGAAINTTSNANSTITTGTTVSGDYTDTFALDQIYWQIADSAGVLDMYYEFLIPADGVPTSVTITGRLNGLNDNMDVFAWDWSSSTWQQVGAYDGQALTTDVVRAYDLFTNHVGTSTDLGKVRIRFYGTGLTSADFYTDQIFLSYAVITRSVGYEDGAIWIDTVNGQPGTTSYINGTADNPVDTLTDATALSASVGLNRFRLAPGSAITLAQSYNNYEFVGRSWSIDLNRQYISDSIIKGAYVTGTAMATSPPNFFNCDIDGVTLPRSHLHVCAITDRVTLCGAGSYFFDQCFSSVSVLAAAVPTSIIDFCEMVDDIQLSIRHWSGAIEFQNMNANSLQVVISIDGNGKIVLDNTCLGGDLAYHGNFSLVNNTGGLVSLDQTAAFDHHEIIDDMHAATISDKYLVLAGSTSTIVKTNAAKANNFYDDMMLVVVNAAGVAVRAIQSYAFTDGAFTLDVSLPFTPAASDTAYVINRTAIHSNADIAAAVWDAIRAGYNAPGSFGETVKLTVDGLADDTITAAKYDEATAFPVVLADTGATKIARTGADSDTLETLSDQIDVVDGVVDNIQIDVTAIKGSGFDSGDSLKAAGDERAVIEAKIDDIQAVTRFRTTAPDPFEVPPAGSVYYRIHVNLEDTDGNPEDPDSNQITVGVTNQLGHSRSGNLSSTTMTRESVGRYSVDYTVASTHLLEQLMFTFTYNENAVTFVKNMDRLVTDAAEVGYTTTDRSRDDQIAIETAAIDGRLPSDPADQSEVEGAIAAAEANIRGGSDTLNTISNQIDALNNLSIPDVQAALTNQGYTQVRAIKLDYLDKAISSLNDLSIADIQTALTNQGYTTGRAALLDNLTALDAAISSVLTAIAALNDLSIADVQTALTNQGYTTIRSALLDNLDAAISGISAAVDALLSSVHGSGSWETGSELSTFRASMADDDSTVTFNVWLEDNGQRRTDLDSIAAKVMDGDGNEIVNLGTQSTSTADGVFKFLTASTNLAGKTSYLLALRGTKAADPDSPWYGNIGMAT
jgi:hypothetical protein